QGIVLVAAVAGAPGWTVAVSLALLVWSFGQSVVFLWHAR
ncbi:CDP-alcohol phosphatidyltransferase family protein, partial [Pseudonocardia sp. KRD-169]|nr:CDP-alcohol phosphatidyltransferase family protein [Pseudonocardia abyssalis]